MEGNWMRIKYALPIVQMMLASLLMLWDNGGFPRQAEV
jgi:hypothetical protein